MKATNKTPLVKAPEDLQLCRAAFVAMIKKENAEGEGIFHQSLQKRWTGKKDGFRDDHVHVRWLDFKSGWEARGESSATNPRPPAMITGGIKYPRKGLATEMSSVAVGAAEAEALHAAEWLKARASKK